MHELPGTPKHPMSGVGLPHNPSSKMLPRVKGCGNPRLTQSSNFTSRVEDSIGELNLDESGEPR